MPSTANVMLTVALSAVLSISSAAQVKGERKVIERVVPVYPQLAKQLNITGTVKLEVTVRANGTVKSTRVAGGSPVLIPSATEAVRKWKFEPASEETTGTVQVSFDQR
jgi:TonB family protein